MSYEVQEATEGPVLRSVTRYNRASEQRSWRQEALWQLQEDEDQGQELEEVQ